MKVKALKKENVSKNLKRNNENKPLYNNTENNKILTNILTKQVKNLYSKNHKTLRS